MIDFILYNDLLTDILIVLLMFTVILTNMTEEKEKKEETKIQNKKDKFQNDIINFWIFILLILFIYTIYKLKKLLSIFIWITIIISFYRIFKNYTSDKLNLNYTSKIHYVSATYFFTLLFSSEICRGIYLTVFASIPHIAKEVLLVTYLIIKIILFIFFLLMNITIIISNVQLLFEKKISTIILKIKNLKHNYNPKYYTFSLSRKKNTILRLNIDKIIYFITCPIFIIYNLTIKLLKSLKKIIISYIIKIYSLLTKYNSNKNLIIKAIIKIALIISLIIVYIIIIYEPYFSDKVKEIYNLLVTVILIPIIYDSLIKKI